MKKAVFLVAGMFLLVGCGINNGYDARPVKDNSNCFQIQDRGHDYKALGTFCRVDLPPK